jgi:hypothetical protein
MLLRNSWYVAASDAEIGSKPLARTILGEPVVLFRTVAGAPVVFEDRCPHRHLPPSMVSLLETNCGATITAFALPPMAGACESRGRIIFRRGRKRKPIRWSSAITGSGSGWAILLAPIRPQFRIFTGLTMPIGVPKAPICTSMQTGS